MNHNQCKASTGIHDELTFGQGELDEFGFWEFPCNVCARKMEIEDNVPINTYWPKENNDE